MMTIEQIGVLFASHILERQQRLGVGGRLVHYTNAKAAYQIIDGREIWLRNASMMNDFSEIQHGIDCLTQAWNSEVGNQLQAMLNRLKPSLRDELAQLFDGHAEKIRLGTFIVSLSEHEDSEDDLGRLSMWRAYGGQAGVGLILNSTAFASTTDAMKVFSSPVFYKDVKTFQEWFAQWTDRLIKAEPDLATLSPDYVRDLLFLAFRNFALCTKHPGFAEEREWRVYHSPEFEGPSDWIRSGVEIIGGVPQLVMKFSLRDDQERAVIGVAPASLVNRVLIGPCDHPLQVRAAIVEALAKAGVPDPLSRMGMSFIPLSTRRLSIMAIPFDTTIKARRVRAVKQLSKIFYMLAI